MRSLTSFVSSRFGLGDEKDECSIKWHSVEYRPYGSDDLDSAGGNMEVKGNRLIHEKQVGLNQNSEKMKILRAGVCTGNCSIYSPEFLDLRKVQKFLTL